jgi:hypothetical protein
VAALLLLLLLLLLQGALAMVLPESGEWMPCSRPAHTLCAATACIPPA